MKKIMLLSAIMIFSCLNSQIKLIDADQVLCPGDSLNAHFKWDQKQGVTNFRIDYVYNFSPVGAQIWSKDNTDFFKLHKDVVGVDTIYNIKLPTQKYWQFGRLAFKTQEANEIFMIEINCGPVGINEYQLNEVRPIYFDLIGNIVEPSPGKLLIKQTGSIRKKVVITE